MESTLTIPRLKALQKEWQRNPPMPILFAAWLGIKPKEYGTVEELTERLTAMQMGKT